MRVDLAKRTEGELSALFHEVSLGIASGQVLLDEIKVARRRIRRQVAPRRPSRRRQPVC